jgi:hypothetical protein
MGVTAGGALASLALLPGQQLGLKLIVAADAASYLAAAALIATAASSYRPPSPAHRDLGVAGAKGRGYRIVLADRDNVLLAVLNVSCAVACSAPLLTMPVYVLGQLRQPSWVPGALAAVSAGALSSSVMIVHRFTHGRNRLSVLVTANLLWTASCMGFALAAASATFAVGICFLAVVGLGLAEAAYAPTADALPLSIAPLGLAGRYTALHQLAWGVASAIVPVLTAALLAAGRATVWIVLATISLITALAYALLPRKLRTRAGVAGLAPAGEPDHATNLLASVDVPGAQAGQPPQIPR